jgi:hypothetical protein
MGRQRPSRRDGADRGAGSVARQHDATDDLGHRPGWIHADRDAGNLVGESDLVCLPVGALRQLRWPSRWVRLRGDRRCQDAGVRRCLWRSGLTAACPRDRRERERKHDSGFEPDRDRCGAGSAASQHPPAVDLWQRAGRLDPDRSPGQWTNNPASYAYQWTRCPQSGGRPDASDCAAIGGATTRSYVVTASSVDRRLRVRATATNATGSATAASNATAVVRAAPPPPVATGCPAGNDAIRPDQISSPARLLVDRQRISPPVVTRGTQTLTVRFRVSACGGRPVQGMLVYVTAVPFNQFTIPAEQTTGGDGWAQLTMRRARSFPAARNQQLLVMFVRARKGGEHLLGGISTRRLVSFPVNLSR